MTALPAAAQLDFPAIPTAAAKPWPQRHATLLLGRTFGGQQHLRSALRAHQDAVRIAPEFAGGSRWCKFSARQDSELKLRGGLRFFR